MRLLIAPLFTLLASALSALCSTVPANFTSATTVPVTAASYTATGNNVSLSLAFAPPTGTNLTVVNNTGQGLIQGVFTNLAQGQIVQLAYGGGTFPFMVTYFGGTGNDLVLRWANQRLLAWGDNSFGQLGNGTSTSGQGITPVVTTGVLAGKTINAISTSGNFNSSVCCADGRVAAWGYNIYYQLGDGTSNDSSSPVLVSAAGVLSGKMVVAAASGSNHSLAMCNDGTLVSWGQNQYGQLGNNSTTTPYVPVLVARTGVLSGKTITAICGAGLCSLALCSDGTLAAWGNNGFGQLGNNGTTSSSVPVAVIRTGVLSGKTVIGLAGGHNTCFALCSDGSLASWGLNFYGQLGNSVPAQSNVPVLVDRTGVLAGKTIKSVSAGRYHTLALCTDGTLAAWGANSNGELGNGGFTNSSVPVLVNRTGVLAGKTPVAISAGEYHCLALCSDGTLAAWGFNGSAGRLGNGSTTASTVPVLVSSMALRTGEVFSSAVGGCVATSSVATAAVPLPTLSSLAINPPGTLIAPVPVNYTADVANSTTSLTLTPATADNANTIKVNGTVVSSGTASAAIPLAVGANPITVLVTGPNGAATTYTITVTRAASAVSTLAALVLNPGSLSPAFAFDTIAYTATVPAGTTSLTVTPTLTDIAATVKVNGTTVTSGSPSTSIPFSTIPATITVLVTAQNGVNTSNYTITLNNIAPSFSGYAVNTPYQTTVAISLSKILTKAADGNGDALSVTAVGPSANGGSVVLQAAAVSYTPPAGFSGAATFPLSVRDSRGATVTGTVTVTVGASSASTSGGVGANPPTITVLSDGKKVVSFQGIPGRTYKVQRSVDDLNHWTTLDTIIASPAGKVSFTDESAPPGSAFYRLALP